MGERKKFVLGLKKTRKTGHDQPMEFSRLSLRTSLYYKRQDLDPFADPGKNEALFCFALNPAQARRIDPEPEHYLGSLITAGLALPSPAGTGTLGGIDPALLELPAGLYYFTQIRQETSRTSGDGWLKRAECVEMAMELQKEGLWERLKLEDRIYVRSLFEDGARVFQVLRPIAV
jgi:hypothetical protein